jgi:gluconolactonase
VTGISLVLGAALLCLPLAAQDLPEISVEKIATGYHFTEGPVWAHDGYLLFSDIPDNTVHKLVPGQQPAVYLQNSNHTNGNTFDAQGRLYSCEGGAHRLVRRNKNQKVEVLASEWEGRQLNAPNDVVVRHDGHVYFTDPAFGSTDDRRKLDFYGVFHITPKGALSVVSKSKTRPNGIALSPDGKILYVADYDQRVLKAYNLDRAGEASAERVLITGIEGPPDGIKVDEHGNLYVACRGIAVYSPQGRLLRMIEMAETPANCAFGDADFRTLYITARTSLYRIRMEVKGAIQY